MIDYIIELSARHRFLTLTLTGFAALAGWYTLIHRPLDVLPDLSENQVIISSRWDRSPDLIEAQVTSPLVASMRGSPGVKSVRGISEYGSSLVYVIFNDDVDRYWARSRTLERLATVLPRLPDGVDTELGVDATALGWIFQYALVDRSGKHNLTELRSFQDWYLNSYLASVPGVAEVAAVGGFVRQYQVEADPSRLRAYGIPIQKIAEALKRGNGDASGGVMESGGREFMVRGLGNLRSVKDLEEILVDSLDDGAPIRVKDVAQVRIGSDSRRGVVDLDGSGEVVSGIVIMRQGENALEVIDRVKAKLLEIEPSMPSGIQIIPVYDRSELVRQSVGNLRSTILEVSSVTALVILFFLWHFPSAIVPLITVPLAVLIAFIPFRLFGITLNIMSLGGIAIAIGAMVDASIVVVEQTHKKLEEWIRAGHAGEPSVVILRAIKQVGRPSFYALLVIAVSFLPVLVLQGEEGRLFRPLAYAKSSAMVVAAILAITLDPALRLFFTRVAHFQFRPLWLRRMANALFVGRIRSEQDHPVSRWVIRCYEPVVDWSLNNKVKVMIVVLVLMAGTIPVFLQLGSEFMPPLDEGALLYMPSTIPGMSISQASQLVQTTDRILKQFPEVDHVLGKAGRADTATDTAPLSMLESVIVLRPQSSWRPKATWYSSWMPEWAKAPFRHITPDRISREDLVGQMNEALKLPGVANAWSMPIRARVDMLTTGIRTPVGIKVSGSNAEEIERISTRIADLLPSVQGTRSVFSERFGDGRFVDVNWDRAALANHGLTLEDAQAAVRYAIGGENVTTVLDGRERYPVSVRYFRDFRDDPEALGRALVVSEARKQQIPVAELANIQIVSGPSMLRNEGGLLTGYIYIDVAGRDPESYVAAADRTIRETIPLPENYSVSWSGQFEAMARMKKDLSAIIPLTLLLIGALLYLNVRSIAKSMIVLLAVPFSAMGAIWILYALGYNLSVAVWVGIVALLGVDAETGVFMLLYLDHAYDQARQDGRLRSEIDLRRAVVEGAARRIRPKLMTVATMFVGLLPVLWSTGAGSDVMKRIAAPLIGGIFTSFLLELLVYPAIYHEWKWRIALRSQVDG